MIFGINLINSVNGPSQGGCQISDFFHRMISAGPAHQGAANHHAIGQLRHLSGLLGGGNAKAHGQGQIGMPPHPVHEVGQMWGELLPGAGDARKELERGAGGCVLCVLLWRMIGRCVVAKDCKLFFGEREISLRIDICTS